MRTLFDLFFDICLLRRGPQDVPAAPALTAVRTGLSGHWFCCPHGGRRAAYPLRSLLLTLADLALLAGMTYGVLRALGHSARLAQTLTALTGCGTLLQLIALPLGIWFDQASASQANAELPFLLWLLLLLWSIVISAHILRHAFTVSFGIGLAYAFAYLFVSWTIADWLLPLAST
ncbi:MAG: hypothetical protein R3F53_17085 [Gammaproteobacteria bacterium]